MKFTFGYMFLWSAYAFLIPPDVRMEDLFSENVNIEGDLKPETNIWIPDDDARLQKVPFEEIDILRDFPSFSEFQSSAISWMNKLQEMVNKAWGSDNFRSTEFDEVTHMDFPGVIISSHSLTSPNENGFQMQRLLFADLDDSQTSVTITPEFQIKELPELVFISEEVTKPLSWGVIFLSLFRSIFPLTLGIMVGTGLVYLAALFGESVVSFFQYMTRRQANFTSVNEVKGIDDESLDEKQSLMKE